MHRGALGAGLSIFVFVGPLPRQSGVIFHYPAHIIALQPLVPSLGSVPGQAPDLLLHQLLELVDIVVVGRRHEAGDGAAIRHQGRQVEVQLHHGWFRSIRGMAFHGGEHLLQGRLLARDAHKHIGLGGRHARSRHHLAVGAAEIGYGAQVREQAHRANAGDGLKPDEEWRRVAQLPFCEGGIEQVIAIVRDVWCVPLVVEVLDEAQRRLHLQVPLDLILHTLPGERLYLDRHAVAEAAPEAV